MSSDTRYSDSLPAASWNVLVLRARLLAAARAFFASRGFLEVETPILSADTVVDRHLDPLELKGTQTFFDQPAAGRRFWLQTSPEFAMKRLMAAGGRAIFQITRAFRGGEAGSLHNPEFTIVEWYRRGDSMADGMQLLSDVAEALLGLGPADSISYREAFERYAGTDPLTADLEQLAGLAVRAIPGTAPNFAPDCDGWLNLLLAELVEPHLGAERPTILYHYPASQAALAQVQGDPPVAERFELYVRGIELANGYHELRDPSELRRRASAANAARRGDGKPELPLDNRLYAVTDHLPDCTGVALGFDRVVMLAAGKRDIRDVLAFPIDRA